MRGYSWKGSYWHPCACVSGHCEQFTKAGHTWLCWWCEHDRCTEVHRLPVQWEEGDYEAEDLYAENPEPPWVPNAPPGTPCGVQGCEEGGMKWQCSNQGCDEIVCQHHSIEDFGTPVTRHCLMCHNTDDAYHDLTLPLRPVKCLCKVCGPPNSTCLFNTWSRVPSLWAKGRLCFDCDVRCACSCADPVVQRRNNVLSGVDEAIGAAFP